MWAIALGCRWAALLFNQHFPPWAEDLHVPDLLYLIGEVVPLFGQFMLSAGGTLFVLRYVVRKLSR